MRNKLSRLASSITSGGTPESGNSDYYDGDISWVQTGDLNDSYVTTTTKTVSELGLKNSSAKIVHKGSLLIAMYGATIGKLGILTMNAATNQACCIICPTPIIDPKFLFYVLFAMRDHLILQAYGGGQQNISQEVIKQEYLLYPPTNVQKIITQFLDQTCAKIDRAISIKSQQLSVVERALQATISRAVLEGYNQSASLNATDSEWLNKLPSTWSRCRLKDVCSIQTGITLGKDYDGELVERHYLRVANVQDGHLALDDVKTIELPARDVARYELRDEDVLMTEGGDLDKLGRGHVWRNEIPGCLHQNHVFAIRCNRARLEPEYLAYLTSSQYGRDYFEITGKRTTNLASTNSTKVGQFPIPLPPLDEQRDIVRFLNEEAEKARAIKRIVGQQIAKLKDYKKSLIHECVTGKRRITTADLRESA
jgi:type I restriction enzyme S subunit